MNTITIFGDITPETVESVAEQLDAIGGAAATVQINSRGGDLFAGLAILNLLRAHGNVRVEVLGLAASAASVVALAGKPIAMAKGSMTMLHLPHGGVRGNAEQVRQYAALLDKAANELIQLYAERTGKSASEVADWLRRETWLSAEEAVAAGLADEILDAPALPFADAWRFASAPAAIAAQLDPTIALKASVQRLENELKQARADLAAARLDSELHDVKLTDEARAALLAAFERDPAAARAAVAQLRDAAQRPGIAPTVAPAVVQRAHVNADGGYAAYMSRLHALQS